MTKFNLATRLLISCAVIGVAPAVNAQVAAPAAPATPTAVDQAGDIIVTAQRRSESVMKVPLSVTVVGGQALTDNGVTNLQSISRLAPSVQYSQDGEFSVRGVGTATFAPTVESSVSQFVDDVAIGNRAFAGNAFYDVDRVEVLNGPQGLLFGKNASAGLINITTTKPKLGVTSGDFSAEVDTRPRPGSNGWGTDLRAALNFPVGSIAAIRLAGIYSYQDPLTRNTVATTTRQDIADRRYGARAKLLVEPSSNLSIYLIGDYFKSSGAGGYYDSTFRSLGANSQYPSDLAAAGVTPGPNNFLTAVNAPNFADLRTGGVQGSISYRMENGLQLTNITAWKSANLNYQEDSDFSPTNYFDDNNFREQFQQVSEELRLSLPDGRRLSGQMGLYYFWSNNKNQVQRGGMNGLPSFVTVGFPFCVNATVTAGPPPACSVSNKYFLGGDSVLTNGAESYAAFGQLSYAVTDTVKLTAGGRVTHDKVDLDLLENTGRYFVTLGVPNNHDVERASATNFSWKLGADWQVTPATLIYGFYGRGYKGPGFSNAAPAPGVSLAVRPEISNGGEIGLKTSLLDHKVTLSIAGFYTRFTNLQVQAFDLALQTITLTNAATATTKGVDLSITVRPFRGLSLSEVASVLDSKYGSYPGAQCYTTQNSPGCSTTGVFDAAGRDLPLSAKFTSTTSADYTHALTDRLDLRITGSYQHRSKLNTGFAPQELIAPLDRFDGSIGLRAANWDVALFCRNCTNQVRPYTIVADAGDSVNRGTLTFLQTFNSDSVRTIGIRLGVSFK